MNDLIRPPTRTVIPEDHHASQGIGKPYPKEYRKLVMYLYDHHPEELVTQSMLDAQSLHFLAANVTINRWLRRCDLLGHVRPFRRTGNHRAVREIVGQALIDLALYRSVSCKEFGYEVRAFLFNRNPTVAPYSASQLCRAEKRLD